MKKAKIAILIALLALTVLAAEHWIPPPRSGALVLETGPEAPVEAPPGRGRKNVQQSELQLGGANDRGRFRDVAPTIVARRLRFAST